jgi:hypothetical protein
MKDPLAILFGSQARVRILRLFLFNPNTVFTIDEMIRRTRLARRTVRTELSALERSGLARRKHTYEETRTRARRRVQGYILNQARHFVAPLRKFFLDTTPINSTTLLRHLRGAGKVEVLVAGGVFKQEFERRLDVLIAMPRVVPVKVDAAMRSLEVELGVEIKYTALPTEELFYRLSMYDRLVRDVFDYAHDLVVDRVELASVVYR